VTRAALYVACSRATSLSGLFFEGEFNPPVKPMHDVVELEISRLISTELQLEADEQALMSKLLSPGSYITLLPKSEVSFDVMEHYNACINSKIEEIPSLPSPIDPHQSSHEV
jgi:hypothetical protein